MEFLGGQKWKGKFKNTPKNEKNALNRQRAQKLYKKNKNKKLLGFIWHIHMLMHNAIGAKLLQGKWDKSCIHMYMHVFVL